MYNEFLDSIALTGMKIVGAYSSTGNGLVVGQEFVVNAIVYFDTQECIDSDSKKHTIDSNVLRKIIKHQFSNSAYNTLEKAASCLIDRIFQDFCQVEKVDIDIHSTQNIKENAYGMSVKMSRQKHLVYLGLGTNLGNKRKNLIDAIDELKKIGKVSKVSSFFVTQPEIVLDQPEFLNAAIKFVTTQNPLKLLSQVKGIEKALGRVPTIPKGPRKIDIDILMYDDCIFYNSKLILPHPHMHERKFVLQPLADIAPFAIHPVYRASVTDLLELSDS